MSTLSQVNYSSFAAYGQWTNRQLREAELRMIGAIDQIIEAAEDTLSSDFYEDEGSKVKSSLSAIRNSIPDDQNSPNDRVEKQHNEAVIEWVSLVNAAATGFGGDKKPFLEKLGTALVETPATILGGAGKAVGGGISATFDNFFKSLSWIVWVVIAIVIIGLAFWYIPGLKSKVFG